MTDTKIRQTNDWNRDNLALFSSGRTWFNHHKEAGDVW